jgi:hypothetical protein
MQGQFLGGLTIILYPPASHEAHSVDKHLNDLNDMT